MKVHALVMRAVRLAVVPVILPTATFATQQFSAVTIETSRDNPKSLFAADIDGDGDVDLVSGAENDDLLAWDENVGGDAKVWLPHTIAGDATGVHSVFVADMDGDGDNDVLAASKGSDTVCWHENLTGAGDLWTAHLITTDADFVKHAVAGDLDRDGDMDVVAAVTLSDEVYWYENVQSDGSVWLEALISNVVDGPARISLDDVDGDGDLDVSTTSFVDTTILWFENDLSGSGLWSGHIVTSSSLNARRVLGADMDQDGDVDLLASSSFADTVILYENVDGIGQTWASRLITSNVDTVKDLHVGDLDLDGDLDVLTASLDDDKIAWFENDSATGTWREHEIEVVVDEAAAVFSADADGDGDLDIFYASIGDDVIGILLSNLRLTKTNPRLAPTRPPG